MGLCVNKGPNVHKYKAINWQFREIYISFEDILTHFGRISTYY